MKPIPRLTTLTTLAFIAIPGLLAAESPPDAPSIIARHLDAIGGRSAAEAAASVLVSGTLGSDKPPSATTARQAR